MKIGKRLYPMSGYFWISYTQADPTLVDYLYNTLRQRLVGGLIDNLLDKIKNDLMLKKHENRA